MPKFPCFHLIGPIEDSNFAPFFGIIREYPWNLFLGIRDLLSNAIAQRSFERKKIERNFFRTLNNSCHWPRNHNLKMGLISFKFKFLTLLENHLLNSISTSKTLKTSFKFQTLLWYIVNSVHGEPNDAVPCCYCL